jgi:hypothetical protein
VVPRLLKRHQGAGAPGVADVHPLDVGAAAEAGHQMGVEARRHPTRTRRRGEEVEGAGRPARLREGAARGCFAEREGAAAEAFVQLVDALAGGDAVRIQIEVTSVDLAVGEEAPADSVGVPGQLEDSRLREPVGWCGGGHRVDLRRQHVIAQTILHGVICRGLYARTAAGRSGLVPATRPAQCASAVRRHKVRSWPPWNCCLARAGRLHSRHPAAAPTPPLP